MGGPAHHVALLSGRRFFPDRYETVLVHGSPAPGEVSLASLAHREGATTVFMPELVQPVKPASDLRALARLGALVRRFRPHVVDTHTAKAGMLGRLAAGGPGIGRPVLVHTFHGHVLEGYFGRSKSELYRRAEQVLGRRTDVLIGVSRATVDDLVRLGVAPKERFRVISLGLDLDRLAAINDADRRDARDELGIAANEIVCTFVGRIAPIKRVDLLIDAFAAAHFADPRLRLWVVGDGEDRSSLEGQAARLGLNANVKFFGYREELASIWAATDLAVLASANEGTPVSLIEAAAAGVPAVSTDVGGVGEALASDAAILVPAGDAGALGDAITQMAGDEVRRHQMGRSARENALPRFAAARLMADIDELYQELLADATGGGPGS